MKQKCNAERKLNEDETKLVEKLFEEWAEIFKQHQKKESNEQDKKSRHHGQGK